MRENIGLYRGKQMGNDEWIEGGIFVGKIRGLLRPTLLERLSTISSNLHPWASIPE